MWWSTVSESCRQTDDERRTLGDEPRDSKVITLWIKELRKAANKVVPLIVSTVGLAHIRLMVKGATTTLIIISPALHSICPLSSLGCKVQNRLPMSMITSFQFAFLSIVAQLQPAHHSNTPMGLQSTFSFVDCNPMKITTLRRRAKDAALDGGVPSSVTFTGA